MNDGKKDVFDKLMHLYPLNLIEDFCKRNKEVLLYLFFGGLAFAVSMVTFALFNVAMGINELTANVLSWFITVLFAFYTNRVWVFQAPTESVGKFLKQIGTFYAGRIITLLVEEAILFVFITQLGCSSMGVKLVAQIIVIVVNYFSSKLLVFKKRSDTRIIDNGY